MHIGILQTGHLPPEMQARGGDYDAYYPRLLDGFGFRFTTWAVVDGVFPDGPGAADGFLITGSRHGAYEDLPWIPLLESFIREVHAAGVPLVGICFGHQIIAQALGGRVEKFAGGWGVGPLDYDWSGDRVTLQAWHQDQVVAAPEGAEVIATSDFCRFAALQMGKATLTIQPHPEFDAGDINTLMRVRAPGVVPEPVLTEAAKRLNDPTDETRIAGLIARHLKEHRHG